MNIASAFNLWKAQKFCVRQNTAAFFSEKMSSLPPHLDYVSLYQTRTAKKKKKKNRAINLSQG